MKKHFIIVCLSLLFTRANAQQDYYHCDYQYLHNSYAITPTLANLLGLFMMPQAQYELTMSKFNYGLTTDGKAYIANNSPGSPYYTIDRAADHLFMVYTTDDGKFAAVTKDQLMKKGIVGEYGSDGYFTYPMKTVIDNVVYRYAILVKEMDGGCIVALKIQ